jgi:hypothetical protein
MTRQFIPTQVHAMEDYLTSATAPVAARMLGASDTTRHIVDGVAGIAGMQSMMTDYEGGAVHLLPMKAHLASDLMMGAGLLATAALMSRKPSVDRWLLAGLGFVAVASALFTKTQPSYKRD